MHVIHSLNHPPQSLAAWGALGYNEAAVQDFLSTIDRALEVGARVHGSYTVAAW
jgi:hypothetical protein